MYYIYRFYISTAVLCAIHIYKCAYMRNSGLGNPKKPGMF